MGSRYTSKKPEFVYYVGNNDDNNRGWIEGPFVNPQKHRENRKFRLEEVPMETKLTKSLDSILDEVKQGMGAPELYHEGFDEGFRQCLKYFGIKYE